MHAQSLKVRHGKAHLNATKRTLWGKATEIQTIEDPKLPRKEKKPVKHEYGEQDTHHLSETPTTITNESTLKR